MKKNIPILAISYTFLVIVVLTICQTTSAILGHSLFPATFLRLDKDTWQLFLTELLGLLLFLILNTVYFRVKIGWKKVSATKLWLLLPTLVVVIGDATLDPHFSFTLTSLGTAFLLGFSVAFFEEYVFRGVLVGLLKDQLYGKRSLAMTLSGVTFGAMHLLNISEGSLVNTLIQTISAMAIGFFLAAVYLISENLLLPIIIHGLIDTFDSLAFGTLSNTSGTSLVTGIVYTVFFSILSVVLYRKYLLKEDQQNAPERRKAQLEKTESKIASRKRRQEERMNSKRMKTKKIEINSAKTIIALIIPIAELLIGASLIKLVSAPMNKVIFTVCMFFVGFLIALFLYKDVLKADWKPFRQHIWRNLGLAILGVIVSYGIISGARILLTTLNISSSAATGGGFLSMETVTIGLIGSLTALMAPFTEEIVFRHVLFYQWRNRGILTWLMFIVSSILFGLVHWNNFNGQIDQMIPYMLVGAWFALIYYLSGNIWQNIMTHFFFDLLQFLAALLLFILTLFQ